MLQNQFFISGLEEDAIIRNRVMEALRRRILLAHKQKKCLRVIIVIPLLPGFQVLAMNVILDWKEILDVLLTFGFDSLQNRAEWTMLVQQL